MTIALELISLLAGLLLLLGAGFILIGGLGLLQFPDFYTRLHAAGITDTLGALLILVGLLLLTGFTLIGAKLVIIALFLLLTTPVASHATAKAALSDATVPPPVTAAAPAQPTTRG